MNTYRLMAAEQFNGRKQGTKQMFLVGFVNFC